MSLVADSLGADSLAALEAHRPMDAASLSRHSYRAQVTPKTTSATTPAHAPPSTPMGDPRPVGTGSSLRAGTSWPAQGLEAAPPPPVVLGVSSSEQVPRSLSHIRQPVLLSGDSRLSPKKWRYTWVPVDGAMDKEEEKHVAAVAKLLESIRPGNEVFCGSFCMSPMDQSGSPVLRRRHLSQRSISSRSRAAARLAPLTADTRARDPRARSRSPAGSPTSPPSKLLPVPSPSTTSPSIPSPPRWLLSPSAKRTLSPKLQPTQIDELTWATHDRAWRATLLTPLGKQPMQRQQRQQQQHARGAAAGGTAPRREPLSPLEEVRLRRLIGPAAAKLAMSVRGAPSGPG